MHSIAILQQRLSKRRETLRSSAKNSLIRRVLHDINLVFNGAILCTNMKVGVSMDQIIYTRARLRHKTCEPVWDGFLVNKTRYSRPISELIS